MKKSRKAFRNNVIVGLMLVAPLFITGYIIHFLIKLISRNWFVRTLADFILGLFPYGIKDGTVKDILGQIIAVLLVVCVLFLIGFFIRSFFGRRLYRIGERLLIRIPVFNKIYVQVRHISETIFQQRETMFNEVVLVEYPRRGVHAIAFVTSTVPAHFSTHFPSETPPPAERLALFVPTTPNPTSGVLLFAPRSEVTKLSMSVPDAMKLVISAGAVYPGEGELDDRPTLLDKLENWITRETNLEPPVLQPPADK